MDKELDRTEICKMKLQKAAYFLLSIERKIELYKAWADGNGFITGFKDDIGLSINPGDIIGKIADLNSFIVKAEISDIHTDVLKINWLANVRMSDCQLSGHISSVLPTIQYGVITFIIELDIKPERFLRSNLLANIDVIISNVENVVTAKNGPYINGSGLHEIFVIEGDKAFKRRDP